ncbi:MAG: VWA domain-containing protein, partial [Verrucomicrobiae bacterium]|nr:VWA domain-containing protein [Verrucomicrobiae bacterium]
MAAILFSNPWPWWIAAPLAVGLGALLAWLYRRERSCVSRAVGWWLTTLRIAAALMLFLTILGPVLSTQVTRTSKDWLLLLVDQSRSMSIRDDPKGPSRFEQVQKTFDHALLQKLQAVSQLRPYRFAASVTAVEPEALWSAPDGDASDLGRPSVAALMDMANERVGAIVVVSDGGHNWGPNPIEAAAKLADRQVKLYTVGVGPSAPPKDVTVTEVATSGLVFTGDQATATVAVRTSGFRGQRLPVRIVQGDKVVGEGAITPRDDQGRDTVVVSFTPSGEGSQLLRAEVVPQAGEANAENNARDFRVQVLKDRLKV